MLHNAALYQQPSENLLQLKSLEQPLAAITAVRESAKQLETAFNKLQLALTRLPVDYRDSVISELREKIETWLDETFIEDEGEEEEGSKIATGQSDRPQVKRGSLAGAAVEMLREKGEMSLSDLATYLAKVGHSGGAEKFRTVLNTAIWRRKDVFLKTGSMFSLRTPDIELVD